MKIKLRAAVHCPEGNFKIGEVVDILSDKIARGLVSGGYASEILPIPEKKVIIPPIPPIFPPTRRSRKEKSSGKECK